MLRMSSIAASKENTIRVRTGSYVITAIVIESTKLEKLEYFWPVPGRRLNYPLE